MILMILCSYQIMILSAIACNDDSVSDCNNMYDGNFASDCMNKNDKVMTCNDSSLHVITLSCTYNH